MFHLIKIEIIIGEVRANKAFLIHVMKISVLA
jgi:hypothetical protein